MPESKWIETASGKVKTYRGYIQLNLGNVKYESELIVYRSDSKYSERRDSLLIGMEFLEENKKILNLDFFNSNFELN